jgi:hypothetical protein
MPHPMPHATTPPQVIDAIDAINERAGYPRFRLIPCYGPMVHQHEPVDGVDFVYGDVVQCVIAGIVVGTARPHPGWGNAHVRCLLPHTRPGHLSPYIAAGLHEGGAFNAFQLHVLTSHGTHGEQCLSLRRADRCRICQTAE